MKNPILTISLQFCLSCFLLLHGETLSQDSDRSMLAEAQPTAVAGLGSYTLKHPEVASIKIPFKMHNGKPLMKLKINGIEASLMIDNGILWDEVWLFGSPIVETLNLKPTEVLSLGGAGEGAMTEIYASSHIALDFGEIVFHEQPVLISPSEAGFTRYFPGVDGQLCNTFFRNFIVEFDFIENNVVLHRPERFEYKGTGDVLEMSLNESGTHSVPFSFTMLDGAFYADKVDIDFGGIYPLKIALGTKHRIQLPVDAKPIGSFEAQGYSSEYRAQIKEMSIGDYSFANVSAVFGDKTTSRIHPENLGVIGLPLFMNFNITFDYINDRVYLEPNVFFAESFE